MNPDAQGTLEEIITAMADYEYVIEVLSTPVYVSTLEAWNTKNPETDDGMVRAAAGHQGVVVQYFNPNDVHGEHWHEPGLQPKLYRFYNPKLYARGKL